MSSTLTPTLTASNSTRVTRSTATTSAVTGPTRAPASAPTPRSNPPARPARSPQAARRPPRPPTWPTHADPAAPGPPSPAQRRRPGPRAGAPSTPPLQSHLGMQHPLGEPASKTGGDRQPHQPGCGGRGRCRAVRGVLPRPGSLAQQRQRPQRHQRADQRAGRGAARDAAPGARQHACQMARDPGAGGGAHGRPREHRCRSALADRSGQWRRHGRLLHASQLGPRPGPSQAARLRLLRFGEQADSIGFKGRSS